MLRCFPPLLRYKSKLTTSVVGEQAAEREGKHIPYLGSDSRTADQTSPNAKFYDLWRRFASSFLDAVEG
jgi:hypothetical protein